MENLMSKRILTGICVSALLLSVCVIAASKDKVVVLREHQRIERAPPDHQDLKAYGFWERQTRYGSGNKATEGDMYNSTIYAWYETTDIQSIELYAFVRYIKGCAFVSRLDATGAEKQGLGVTRQHYGRRIVYVHPEWEIDSDDRMPMHGSSAAEPLLPHYAMEWGETKGVFPEESHHTYGEDPPTEPRLYLTAAVIPAAHLEELGNGTTAINHSFEFKTCLYHSGDVPQVVDSHTFIKNPVDCYSWSSSFIYDHQAKVFTSPQGIADICRPKTIPSPDKKWEDAQ